MRIFGIIKLEMIRILILHVNMRTNLRAEGRFKFVGNELPRAFTPAIAFW